VHLVQVLLPVADNEGRSFPPRLFEHVREVLTERFGGLTAFTRAPAEGFWKGHPERTSRDDIVVVEVMVETIEREWWSAYRRELETRFRQQEIVIRAQDIELL
jgi:hypothetical protein